LIKASGLSDREEIQHLAHVDSDNFVYFLLHSVFMLACSILTAWKLKNTFASLLAIVPLAFIPSLLIAGVAKWMRWQGRYLLDEQSNTWLFIITSITAVVFAWLAYRVACRSFEPADAPRMDASALDRLEAWKPPRSTVALKQPLRYSSTALIWQSIHHNQLVLVGITALVMLGATCTALLSFKTFIDFFGSVSLGLGASAGFLGVSWLGVFVFTGDGSERGLRFLADRGVSPSQVWCARQLIGLSILSWGILLFAVLTLSPLLRQYSTVDSMLSVATITATCLLTYSISQWTSQLIRILSASALLAPLLVWIAIYLAGNSIELFAVPIWLTVLLFCGLPLLATWLLMQRFMDSQRGFSFYFYSISLVAIVILLPLAMFAIEVGNTLQTRIPVLNRLVAAVKTLPRDMAQPWQIVRADQSLSQDLAEPLSGNEAAAIIKEKWIDPHERFNLAELNDESQRPIHASAEFVKEIVNSATYAMLKLRQSPDDGAAKESMRRWVIDLTRIARGLRRSERWIDQAASDSVEIWLTQALSSDLLASQTDERFIKQAIELVADREGRSRDRHRAVLLTWGFPPKYISYDRLGFPMQSWGKHISQYRQDWFQEDLVLAIVDRSLKMIEEGRQGRSTVSIRRELHQLVFDTRVDFEDGPYGDQNQIAIGPDSTFDIDHLFTYPAMAWYAPWEAAAEQLGKAEAN
jgi:hypothetical protein